MTQHSLDDEDDDDDSAYITYHSPKKELLCVCVLEKSEKIKKREQKNKWFETVQFECDKHKKKMTDAACKEHLESLFEQYQSGETGAAKEFAAYVRLNADVPIHAQQLLAM